MVFYSLFGCKQNSTKEPEIKEKSELLVGQPLDSILRSQLELIAVEDQTLRLMLPEVGRNSEMVQTKENMFGR